MDDQCYTTTVDYVYRALKKGHYLRRLDAVWRSMYQAIYMKGGCIYHVGPGPLKVRVFTFHPRDFCAQDWTLIERVIDNNNYKRKVKVRG
jgi:hypothetical protein